jgi:hypothetical protein
MGRATLAFRNASRHVRRYTNESADLMRRHAEAIDCRDCEDFLQLGIDAFDWLNRADESIRRAILSGRAEYDPKVERTLLVMYTRWLKPCEHAEKWIAVQEKRGFRVENVERFRECCAEVRAMVEDSSLLDNDTIINLRDDAVDAYLKGETLEFREREQS